MEEITESTTEEARPPRRRSTGKMALTLAIAVTTMTFAVGMVVAIMTVPTEALLRAAPSLTAPEVEEDADETRTIVIRPERVVAGRLTIWTNKADRKAMESIIRNEAEESGGGLLWPTESDTYTYAVNERMADTLAGLHAANSRDRPEPADYQAAAEQWLQPARGSADVMVNVRVKAPIFERRWLLDTAVVGILMTLSAMMAGILMMTAALVVMTFRNRSEDKECS